MRRENARMARKAAYRKKRQNKMGMLLVTMVVLMMLLVVTVKSVELREKRALYMAKEEALMEEIESEQERTEEIAEYEKYTQTKKYVEEVAKEKLGLVYDGEIIFKDEN
jgi:cell division protein FtsB